MWCAVSPLGALYFYDEYYESGRDIRQNAEAILEQENRINIPIFSRRIDPHAFKRQYSGDTCADQYYNYGLNFAPGDNDLEAGIDMVRTYLHNATRDDTNPARCYFLPHLINTFREFRRHVMNEYGDKPKKGNDHLMSCLRYAIMDNPTYVGHKQLRGWTTKVHVNELTGARFSYDVYADEEV